MGLEHLTRILIVEDRREVARVLRTSLELLNRGYQITDVPSGEEALLECQRIQFDLLITDFRLPGISGAELIRRARKRIPDLRAIIITGVPLYEVEKQVKDLEILGVFQKPLDVDAFVSRVDEILLGDAPFDRSASMGVQPAAVIDFDRYGIERELSVLLNELGAQSVALMNGVGKILLKQGSFDTSLRINELAVLLASNFLTTAEVGSYLGNGASGAVHYYAGKWNDVFALSAGMSHFLAIVFPGNNQKQMGGVLRLGKSAAERIGHLLAADLHTPAAQVPVEQPSMEQTSKKPYQTSLVEEIRAQKRREAEEAALRVLEDEPTPVVFAELLEDNGNVEAIDLDFDELDADLDDLSDLDSLWDTDEDGSMMSAQGISLDEAVELGLLPKDFEE